MPQLQGLLGVIVILAIAFALSTNRREVRPRIVLAALALQIAMAALALYVPAGKAVLGVMSDGVQAVIDFSSAGINMVFGPLSTKVGFSFAINVLPIIIFFSALMSVLYHLGVMQVIVAWGGGALRLIVGTGRVESLTAAANVFLGQTEAPLVVKPYLPHITRPQLFSIMVTGMASVSGSVLVAYAQMGISVNYLLAASFMSAPGGLLMAHMIMPSARDEIDTLGAQIKSEEKEERTSIIMAAADGAEDGLKLALSIAAMLIAFVSLIAMLNGLLGYVGGWFGNPALTMQQILGFVFAPVMFLLDVPWAEARTAGAVFGEKLILNEFVAYLHLGEIQSTLSPKTVAITTFALCGFANLSSIAILLGAFRTLAPDKAPDVARYGLHVVAAGSLSNLLSAALAGVFLSV